MEIQSTSKMENKGVCSALIFEQTFFQTAEGAKNLGKISFVEAGSFGDPRMAKMEE